MIEIQQKVLTDDIKEFILDGFSKHSISVNGFDGFGSKQIAFISYDDGVVTGAISVFPLFGALWIKFLYIEEKYRGQGIGRLLMENALRFGKEQNLDFAFVETLSFQAPEFYQKLGFELEFTRSGYKAGISFHYLRKNL